MTHTTGSSSPFGDTLEPGFLREIGFEDVEEALDEPRSTAGFLLGFSKLGSET